MSDLRKLAHLQEQIGERRWDVLINSVNTGKVKEFCGHLANKNIMTGELFDLTVDYSQTVEQMIASGKYDLADPDINEKHFPLPAALSGKTISVSAKLFHCNLNVNSEYALDEMDEIGFCPATPFELFALGETYPELQKKFPILALGSGWRNKDGDLNVPVLACDHDRRVLDLELFEDNWAGNYRFLGISSGSWAIN